VSDASGNANPGPVHVYVDDTLITAPGLERIKKALVACIEAIFVALGKPDTRVRQCPLAIDKWIGLLVSHEKIVLGLV